MMHVCMVVGEFPPVCAGIGNYVYNLSKVLLEKGFEVTVITRGSFREKITYTKYEDINVWYVRFIPLYPYHVKFHEYFLNEILSKHENEFDIIHLHNPLVPFPKTSLPVIVTEHGTVEGGISNSSNIDLTTIALRLFSKMFIKHDFQVLDKSDIITTVSHSCLDDIKKNMGEKKEMHVIGNGVNTTYFKPDDNIKRENNVILYTGRLDSRT